MIQRPSPHLPQSAAKPTAALRQNVRKPPFSSRSRRGKICQSPVNRKTAESCEWHGRCYVPASCAFKFLPSSKKRGENHACVHGQAYARGSALTRNLATNQNPARHTVAEWSGSGGR